MKSQGSEDCLAAREARKLCTLVSCHGYRTGADEHKEKATQSETDQTPKEVEAAQGEHPRCSVDPQYTHTAGVQVPGL